MTLLLQHLPFFSATLSGALFSAIWEGAVLAAAVVLGLRLLPGLSAAARSVIWLNVFVLLLLLHFVPALASNVSGDASGRSSLHLDWRWSLAVVALWAALSFWRAFQLVHGAVHLRRLARRAIPVATDPELTALLNDAPNGRAARLCVSEEVARPSVLGFLHPRVLIPATLLEVLSAQELRQVVLHEMEHLRRADDWTNLLQKLALVLFPLNPVLLWVERRLCAERELACDDRVVRSAAGRKAYALCLTHLAEYSLLRRSFSLVLGAFERRSELVRRVHRILQQPGRTMSRKAAIVTTGSLLSGALACALVLAHSPQLVSFVPTVSGNHPGNTSPAFASALDPQAVARALGGTPQLVKAALPNPRSAQPANHPHRPVVRHTRTQAPAGLTASLRQLPPANSKLDSELDSRLDQQTAIVLTEFRTVEVQPRVVLTVAPDPRFGPSRVKPAVAVPARYAVIPLPNGWLIIQI
jgi:beta-lactamase regulating signal transducer with metallopeptidase domain